MTNIYQQARLSKDHRFDGKFFIAVKTTKIFCRPICPANSPLEKNVEYFEIAEHAMVAGYRPCLRCRPDSAPNSYAWQGIGTTINRAMQLLREFPELSIEELSAKLGISSRYFRQLFQQKLGMSPKQFQLFNKVLFAKQLLHQSQLSVEQVAQASGFASARRLQDHFKKVTGLTPTSIRQNKVTETNEELNKKSVKLNLAFRPPYNWKHIKDFLFLRCIEGVETITDSSYSRTFIITKDGKQDKGWFKVEYQGHNHCLKLEIKLSNLSQLRVVLLNIERVFDLKADTQGIQSQLIKAGISSSALVKGLRLPGVWDTFEAGCRAILGQQISVKSAISLLSTLTENLGNKADGLLYFPTAESVANSDLAFLKMPNNRKQTLLAFAEFISVHPNQNIDSWLNIKGIGPWTVAYAKMRGLSCPDIWLDTDLVIKKQLAKNKINADCVKPWRSYLTFQLWSMA
jgi:AraC family transcriptional regulator of adaptative response / DNA-3-methyladenine glycosylase II